jgi:CheY-like chemotaxis protein
MIFLQKYTPAQWHSTPIYLSAAEKDLGPEEPRERFAVLNVLSQHRDNRPSEPDWSHHVMRILIVEDEPLIALNTQADLEAAGHTVIGIAMTSREAFGLAESGRPHLVLMDIRLAEGNGVEAAWAIHSHLGISSLFATSHVEKPASAGNAAIGCLQKPYDQRSLVRSIQIAEQVMNGLEPTLPLPRNLKLYERKIDMP